MEQTTKNDKNDAVMAIKLVMDTAWRWLPDPQKEKEIVLSTFHKLKHKFSDSDYLNDLEQLKDFADYYNLSEILEKFDNATKVEEYSVDNNEILI